MNTSRKSLPIAVAVIAALALPTASALAYGAARVPTPPTPPVPAASPDASAQQASAASQNPPPTQDEATSFIGYVAATPEGRLLASNVPVAAAPDGQPRMMVLRRDGTTASPEESGMKVVRNPDGTVTVQRVEEGEAGAAGEAPPATADEGKGDATAATPPAAAAQADATPPAAAAQGDAGAAPPAAGESTTFVAGADGEGAAPMSWVSQEEEGAAAPASEEALQFTEFVIDENTEVIGTMVPGTPVQVDFDEVDGVKIARRVEVLGG